MTLETTQITTQVYLYIYVNIYMYVYIAVFIVLNHISGIHVDDIPAATIEQPNEPNYLRNDLCSPCTHYP